MAKPSLLQTPRPSNRRRSEAPPPKRSNSISTEENPNKIVGKCSNPDFSSSSEVSPSDPGFSKPQKISGENSNSEFSSSLEDPLASEPDLESFINDPEQEEPSSSGSAESFEISSSVPLVESQSSEVSALTEESPWTEVSSGKQENQEVAVLVNRLREALLEVRKSTDLSFRSNKLLDALIGTAIEDLGGEKRRIYTESDPVFRSKARVGIYPNLLALVVIFVVIVTWGFPIGSERRFTDFDLPPT